MTKRVKFADVSGRYVEVLPVVQSFFCTHTSTEKVKLWFQVRHVEEIARRHSVVLNYDSPLENLNCVFFEGFVSGLFAASAEDVRFVGWQAAHAEAYHSEVEELRRIVAIIEKLHKAIEKTKTAAAAAEVDFTFGRLATSAAKVYGAERFIERRYDRQNRCVEAEHCISGLTSAVDAACHAAVRKVQISSGLLVEEVSA